MKKFKIITLPGDGIGPEVITESIHILRYIQQIFTNVPLYLKDTDQQ